MGEFIQCEYNREGSSYRSPWSNTYFPETELPKYPPNELRVLEENMNKLFKIYARFYYGPNAVSSVFVWEQGNTIQKGFSAVLLVKNIVNNDKKLKFGDWDSKNIVNVNFNIEKDKNVERIKATYKINTNVIFNMKFDKYVFSGEVSKQVKKFLK